VQACKRARFTSAAVSDRDPLDLIERDFVAAAVVELGRPGRFRIGDVLATSSLPPFFGVGSDAGCPEGVIAD
jgi:hypothetical protein